MENVVTFERISGIRKIIRCVSCRRKVEVKNLNRIKCKRCEK